MACRMCLPNSALLHGLHPRSGETFSRHRTSRCLQEGYVCAGQTMQMFSPPFLLQLTNSNPEKRIDAMIALIHFAHRVKIWIGLCQPFATV